MLRLDRTPKTRYIWAIGLELEGGICYDKLNELYYALPSDMRPYLTWDYDGSVSVPRPEGVRCDWVRDVEIKYMALSPEEAEVVADLVWQHGFRQNSTCGNHHHLSFRVHHYYVASLLASLDFVGYYIERYVRTFKGIQKYMDRLINSYCKRNDNEWRLCDNIGGHRYYSVNFAALYKHGTVEIRIMPYAANAEEYKRQLRFNVKVVEGYVRRRFGAPLEVDLGEVRTEELEEVPRSEEVEEVI